MIRKFLDAQRIHNLTAYLQTLHRQSLANADHTTLLLNCYTKLKDSSKLEEFIKVWGVLVGEALRVPLSMRWRYHGLPLSRCWERKELTLCGDQDPLVYKLGRGTAFPASSVPAPFLFFDAWTCHSI